MKRFLIVHYAEIGLKKDNAPYFIEKLRDFLRMKLEKKFRKNFSIKHTLGRFLIELPEKVDEEKCVEILQKISGVKNFKFVCAGSLDLEKLAEEIWSELKDELESRDVENFRVTVKRSMTLPFNSNEAERELGAKLLELGLNLPAKMKGADLEVDIEFFNNLAFFSFQKYSGPGGLSPNSQGKLVSLISSGIDSPVASYLMMRRGARVIFAHFHGYPYTDKDEMDQCRDIVKILSDYQLDTKLYLIPFGQFQKAIGTNLEIPGRVRTVLYRRMMLRVAERISRMEKANGLVTGDNFGQVASQTPENMFAIHEASTVPLFQPLIGFDKDEIILWAKKISTFEISKLPCKDACTMFMPRKPELRAKLRELRECESKLDLEMWMKKMVEEAEVIKF